MVTTKTIQVCTCDRCKKEINIDNRWQMRVKRLQVDREFDLCDHCNDLLTRFMWNKPVDDDPPSFNDHNHPTPLKVLPDLSDKTEDPASKKVNIDVRDVDVKRTLPAKLRKFRKDNKLTYEDLAELSGVSKATLYRIESGSQGSLERIIS